MNQLSPQPSTASDATTPWWQGAVIYHIYPLSFADGNGDGYGDLAGVTSRLAHVKSLGVDAIWLSPFYKSPMRDYGYDISDYCDIDPLFGTLADFDAMVAKAHALGLKVIVDQVYSHTSDQHPWFQESRQSRDNPKADWYVWADAKPDGSPPNNWQSVFKASTWTWDARRCQYYLHNFQSDQPDLNVHHPEVQEALLAVARFWLDRGVDGFRLDAINFAMHDPQLRDNPPILGEAKRQRPFDFQHHFYNQSHPDIPKFLARVRALTDAYGGRFLVAEVGGEQAESEMKLYTMGSDRLNSAYGFQFLYADKITPALVQQCADKWRGVSGEGWPSWAFSNHDAPRAVSRWSANADITHARLFMALLICLRGSVFLYQGEELGLPQGDVPFSALRDPEAIANWPLTLGRDGARTPMVWDANAPNAGFGVSGQPWLPIDARHVPLAVASQESDSDSMLHRTRDMVGWRKQFPALRIGSMEVFEAPAGMLVFQRGTGDDAILCAFNLSSHDVAWSLGASWTVATTVNCADEYMGVLPAHAALLAHKVK